MIRSAAKTLDADVTEALFALGKLSSDQAGKLCPSIFNFNTLLRDAMTNGDEVNVAILLERAPRVFMCAMPAPSLSVINFGSKPWHDYVYQKQKDTYRYQSESPMELKPCDGNEFLHSERFFVESLGLMRLGSTLFYEHVRDIVSYVTITEGHGCWGLSSIDMFGDIFITKLQDQRNPHVHYFDHVTHEAAHYYLHALMQFDPLIENPPTEEYSSPVREDKRPMLGVYHAAFVLSNVCQNLQAILDSGVELHDKKSFQQCFDVSLAKFNQALSTVEASAKHTLLGKSVTESMRDVSRGLS
ncbi:HEXXH motif-containing putative peptide modification protein [Parvularcula sp. IMCC14364]|uniref:aKG-HExxH-type peptide beta-hydroxylase n=1 Tax=Parvularcula sp. IMCC14364 TaxID=3067902 RepID=UPI002741B9CB|nr:HEXXH motif-containing putative peptide modification protein [Parvularcula sp. IMCC14364]